MRRFLQKYAIIIFFCTLMGGIIMADCIFAVSFTIRERGIAAEFSNDTKKLSILQADSEYAFQQKDLEEFLGKYGVNTAINLSKVNSQSGVELYSNKVNYFDTEEDGNFGVWLREDQYDSWKKTNEDLFYYKGKYYEVLGEYTRRRVEEKFVVNMEGELSLNPQIAVKGVYYLDCGENTNTVYETLYSEILTKNPYAQITVLEETANGYLVSRLLQSGNAMYYLLQMGILVILNILNFGNIAGYWVTARKQEIFVRKMVGGTVGEVFMDLIVPFIAVTGLFIMTGMLISMIMIGINIKVMKEAIIFSSICGSIQWFLLAIFECIILWKQINKSVIEIKKQD